MDRTVVARMGFGLRNRDINGGIITATIKPIGVFGTAWDVASTSEARIRVVLSCCQRVATTPLRGWRARMTRYVP